MLQSFYPPFEFRIFLYAFLDITFNSFESFVYTNYFSFYLRNFICYFFNLPCDFFTKWIDSVLYYCLQSLC